MPIRLSRFEMPHNVQIMDEGRTPTYTRFVAEPFEIGYARTIGNSLRRVLLSSIEGAAISSVKIKGVTGEILLQLLELRLDNVVYRLGLAPSRRSARQFVLHGHILVNDRKAAVPSMVVRVGDVIAVKDAAKSKDAANRSVEAATGAQLPVWMQFDKANLKAEVLAVPTREQIAPIVDEQAIVELYSR